MSLYVWGRQGMCGQLDGVRVRSRVHLLRQGVQWLGVGGMPRASMSAEFALA